MKQNWDNFLKDFNALNEKGETFAVATVVSRDAPSSGKIGDKAIINNQGKMIGWIGGGCVQGIVLKESLDAIKTSKSRLVVIGNNLKTETRDCIKEYKMTCHSEGKVDIFIEPVLPNPHLIVIGKSPNAKALVHLAKTINFKVTAVADGADLKTFGEVDELITQINLDNVKSNPSTMIVVASQGEHDQKSLMEAIKKKPFFLGFVASSKKIEKLKKDLSKLDVAKEDIDRIKSPVGLDIQAKQPYEVAISILAELIQEKSKMPAFSEPTKNKIEKDSPLDKDYYINPVCGIPIDKKNPKHIVEYKNEKVYFCCDGCKIKFDANPSNYIK